MRNSLALAAEPFGGRKQNASNPYVGRWRWWYPNIADWMLRNPGRPLRECALALGKAENTIYYITNTDMFREYFAQRRLEWRQSHDQVVQDRLFKIAECSMDALLTKLTKQQDAMPAELLDRVASSALDRLGYGPKAAPQVQINQQVNAAGTVSVSLDTLAEARAALRRVEEQRLAEPLPANEVGRERTVFPDSEAVRLAQPIVDAEIVG